MSVLRYKLLADLRQSKARSLLAVVNIAIGIFCVGMLFGMVELLLDKMDASHRQAQPSHISLILRGGADNKLLDGVRALQGVAGVDTLSPLTVRYRRPGETDWQDATLMVRPDYAAQRYDLTTLAGGAWPSGKQIALENLSQAASGLAIGDSLEFEGRSGPVRLPIGGIVRHSFVKPPKFGGQLHFFADAATAAQFGLPQGYFRQLLVQTQSPYDQEKVAEVAADIRQYLAHHQLSAAVTLLQDPERHWGRPFVAGINSVLQVMALASLLLASILIFNTVSAHITQQTEQIGVIKALGGSNWSVAKLYLSEVALMALAAIGLAVPPAVLGADWASRRLLALFNVAGGGFSVAPLALAAMLAGGLLAPLMAALPPIWRGATMTVRVAMASYGLGGDFGGNRFDRWIEKLGARWLPTLYAAALGNLFRQKGRLLLTQGVLIVAGVMVLVLASLIASLNLTLDNELARSRYAVKLGFASDLAEARVAEIAGSLPQTRSLAVWQRLPLEISKNGRPLLQTGSLGMQMLAVPAGSELYRPLVEDGRWLQAGDAGQRQLLLSADTAAKNALRPGDWVDVKLAGHRESWQIAGVYRWLVANNFVVEPVYVPRETVATPSKADAMASFALLDADIADSTGEQAYLQALKSRFAEAGIALDAYTSEGKLAQRQYTRNQFNSVLGVLSGLVAMIAAIGGIGLSGTLAISVLQRVREIGVLRAIGAPSPAVFRLFLLEGLLHGVCAWLISVPLACFAAEPMADRLGKTMLGIRLDYRFDNLAALYWLAVVATLAWLAAYWPARKAAGFSIIDCFRH